MVPSTTVVAATTTDDEAGRNTSSGKPQDLEEEEEEKGGGVLEAGIAPPSDHHHQHEHQGDEELPAPPSDCTMSKMGESLLVTSTTHTDESVTAATEVSVAAVEDDHMDDRKEPSPRNKKEPPQHGSPTTATITAPDTSTDTSTAFNTKTDNQKNRQQQQQQQQQQQPASSSHQRPHRGRRRRVIVIGSGMAGLCAARELQQRGYQILIVEAQARLGGRLKSYEMQLLPQPNPTTSISPWVPASSLLSPHHGSNTYSAGGAATIPATATATASVTTTTAKTAIQTNQNHHKGNFHSQNNSQGNKHMNHNNLKYKRGDTPSITTTKGSTSTSTKSTKGSTFTSTKSTKESSSTSTKSTKESSSTSTKSTKGITPSSIPTTTTSTVPIDIGGALIHGIVDNPLHTMVHTDMNISIRPLLSEDCLLLSNNGWPVDIQHDKHISQLFNDCLSEAFNRIENITKTTMTSTTTTSSFGDVFDQICRERNVNTNVPLFRWYQANLELSSGTTFHNLGYTWNDDEPYGYDGDHVALTSSWKSVCTTLGETLYVLYNSPVTNIQVVYPDPELIRAQTVEHPPSQQLQQQPQQLNGKEKEGDDDHKSSLHTPIERPTKMQKKMQSKSSTTLAHQVQLSNEPLRKSKRIRGEDVIDENVRRSNRSNKGRNSAATTHSSSYTQSSSSKKRSRNDGPTTNGATKTTKEVKTMVHVTLKSGITLEADAVVCTIPLGVLKDGSVTFDPPLPLSKQMAIQQLGSGLFNKCAMTFAKQFWQDSDFLGMADTQHSYLILNASKYTNQPVLLFIYGGAFAKEIEEWTDHDVVNDCLSILRRICGRECVTNPIDYHVTRWGKDPFSRMSFTFVPPGVDGLSEFKAMSEPIYDHTGTVPVLMFAGEHTTPYHPSTIHGAYLSGIREAYRYDCALEPEANHFLDFTEDNIYERTFAIKRKSKNTSTIARNESSVAGTSLGTWSQVPEPTTGTRAPPAMQKTIQSYARQRRNGNNGMMKLRRRTKSYGSLHMSTSRRRDDIRGAVPSTEPNAIANRSMNANLPANANPMSTRRSQRLNMDHTKSPGFPEPVISMNGDAVAVTESTTQSNTGSPSPTRRSQRTGTSAASMKVFSQTNRNGFISHLPEPTTSLSSIMKVDATTTNCSEDPAVIAALMHREHRAHENRILLRSIESYGRDYDFIHKTVLPIYPNGYPSADVGNNAMPMDRHDLEQRCVKLLRKSERINAQREATVLHYYKSWIATKIATPSSTMIAETSKQRATEATTSHRNDTKTYVFVVPRDKAVAATTTTTTTRSGRTSKRPATMLL